MQGNVLGQIGSSTELNIFTQPNEPSKKEGVWIKTTENYKYEKVQFVEDFSNSIKSYFTRLKDLPAIFTSNSAYAVGTEIYLFYSDSTYKYNTLTGEYTQIEALEVDTEIVAIVDTDIYIFSNNNTTTKYVSKYNTLTNEYTRLINMPNSGNDVFSSAVSVGTDIYLFGGAYAGEYYEKTYKYDTLNNEFTEKEDLPFPSKLVDSISVAIDTDIYLFGRFSNGGDKYYTYKYNTLTNQYIQIENIPYDTIPYQAVAVGTDIYMFGINDNVEFNCKYNTLTGEYFQIDNLPYSPYGSAYGGIVEVDKNIYILGGSQTLDGTSFSPGSVYNFKYIIDSGVTNKTILIEIKYHLLDVILSDILKIYFSNAKIYDNNALQDYPTYYGNGQEWILLE